MCFSLWSKPALSVLLSDTALSNSEMIFPAVNVIFFPAVACFSPAASPLLVEALRQALPCSPNAQVFLDFWERAVHHHF